MAKDIPAAWRSDMARAEDDRMFAAIRDGWISEMRSQPEVSDSNPVRMKSTGEEE